MKATLTTLLALVCFTSGWMQTASAKTPHLVAFVAQDEDDDNNCDEDHEKPPVGVGGPTTGTGSSDVRKRLVPSDDE